MRKNIALILGSFHKKEAEQMLNEAKKTAKQLTLNIVEIVWVPGSYEKPLALKRLLGKKNIDGVVLLGIIEKGETKHGLIMAKAVAQAIIDLELKYMKPVGFGILGPEILPNQISKRLKPYARQAVEAVKKML